MRSFKVINDLRINNNIFAYAGEILILLPDNNTLVKHKNGQVETQYLSHIDKLIKEGILEELKEEPKKEMVNHPSHYTWLKEKCGVEPYEITRYFDNNIGNVLKYCMRHGHKSEEGLTDKEKAIQDLEKALFYLKDEIKLLKEE